MPTRNGNALRESAHPGNVAEHSLHRGRSLNIANLPNDLREQLDLRLLEGETGRELAAWLNALPEVQSMLGSQFNGSPVSEVNLTHWRQGGYLQWLTERECFASARALADGDGDLASTGLSAERLLNVLTVRFGQVLMQWDTSADENISESAAFLEIARKARILQGISRSVFAIHRIQSQSALHKSAPATTSRAEATKRGGGSASSPASLPQDITTRRVEVASRGGEKTSRNGTIFPTAGRPAKPNILSGPITPSNLSQTPFNPGHDLEEILNAI